MISNKFLPIKCIPNYWKVLPIPKIYFQVWNDKFCIFSKKFLHFSHNLGWNSAYKIPQILEHGHCYYLKRFVHCTLHFNKWSSKSLSRKSKTGTNKTPPFDVDHKTSLASMAPLCGQQKALKLKALGDSDEKKSCHFCERYGSSNK